VFHSYKQGAEARNLPMELTFDQFVAIIENDCEYCGCPPDKSNLQYRRKNPHSYLRYNGIDRLDNTKGYVVGNVVPCCKTCNMAKSSMTFEAWLDWMENFSKHAALVLLKYRQPDPTTEGILVPCMI
jgi:hypothetical protein